MIDTHLREHIALTHTSTVLLCQVGRLPGNIKMMYSTDAVLNIRTCSEF